MHGQDHDIFDILTFHSIIYLFIGILLKSLLCSTVNLEGGEYVFHKKFIRNSSTNPAQRLIKNKRHGSIFSNVGIEKVDGFITNDKLILKNVSSSGLYSTDDDKLHIQATSPLPPSAIALTGDKTIPTRSGMRHCPLKYAIRVENDPIRTWVAAGVGLIGLEDGELLIRAGTGQAECFIIVECMRVVVAANRLAVAVIVAALVDGIIDIRLPVADATAGVYTSLTLCTETERMSRCK